MPDERFDDGGDDCAECSVVVPSDAEFNSDSRLEVIADETTDTFMLVPPRLGLEESSPRIANLISGFEPL
jgi:hypothetical protein